MPSKFIERVYLKKSKQVKHSSSSEDDEEGYFDDDEYFGTPTRTKNQNKSPPKKKDESNAVPLKTQRKPRRTQIQLLMEAPSPPRKKRTTLPDVTNKRDKTSIKNSSTSTTTAEGSRVSTSVVAKKSTSKPTQRKAASEGQSSKKGFIPISDCPKKESEGKKYSKSVRDTDWGTVISTSDSEQSCVAGEGSATVKKAITESIPEADERNGENSSKSVDQVETVGRPSVFVVVAPRPVPARVADTTVVKALLDENFNEYSKLSNAEKNQMIKVPVNAKALIYSYPQDQKWEELHPDIMMSLVFNNGKIKTGFLRVGCRTIKPFEKTHKTEINFSVMEGVVIAKSSNFGFTNAGLPCLIPVELTVGSFFQVPQNSMYSLENWEEDEEAFLYYTVIHHD